MYANIGDLELIQDDTEQGEAVEGPAYGGAVAERQEFCAAEVFEEHQGCDEEEPGCGDQWGDGGEGGDAEHWQQEEGAGEGDGHHVAEVVPAKAGWLAADDRALEEDLAGADGIFAIGVAEGHQADEEVGIGGEYAASDKEGEEEPGQAVPQTKGGLE